MVAGDQVFVAYAIVGAEIIAAVYPAEVMTVVDGEVIARCSHGVVHTPRGSTSAAFATEPAAWAWAADRLRAKAAEITAAAARCEAAVASEMEAA